jgi:hypothetical protein
MLCNICQKDTIIQSCCENDHQFCITCILLLKKCEVCNKPIEIKNDFKIEACEDIYNKKEIYEELNDFISRWKSANFLRKQKKTVLNSLSEIQLNYLSSSKINKTYKLFRGVDKKFDDKYIDFYPSSWSENIDSTRMFGRYIYMIEVKPEHIMFDLLYLCNDYEKEIILFHGSYECVLVEFQEKRKPGMIPMSSSSSSSPTPRKYSKEIFNRENIDYINKCRAKCDPLCWTVSELKNVCKDLELSYSEGKLKIYYLNKIVDHYASL